MATYGRNRGKNKAPQAQNQQDNISKPQGKGGGDGNVIEESGMRVSGDYYLPDQVSGTRHFSTGTNKVTNTRGNRTVKRASLVHSNPHSRLFNDLTHGRSRRMDNRSTISNRPVGKWERMPKPTIMRGNQVFQKSDLVYYTYALTGKRYLGNRQYQGGGGNWFVDERDGRRLELKQHTVIRNEVTDELETRKEILPGTREFQNWVDSFNSVRGCQCARVNWWSGHYNRHCVGSQCASPGAACFGNLNPCAVSKDGKDTFTTANYSK